MPVAVVEKGRSNQCFSVVKLPSPAMMPNLGDQLSGFVASGINVIRQYPYPAKIKASLM